MFALSSALIKLAGSAGSGPAGGTVDTKGEEKDVVERWMATKKG